MSPHSGSRSEGDRQSVGHKGGGIVRQVTAALQLLSRHELSLSPAAHQPRRWDPPQLPLLSQSVQREAGDSRLAGEDFPWG